MSTYTVRRMTYTRQTAKPANTLSQTCLPSPPVSLLSMVRNGMYQYVERSMDARFLS